MIAKSIIKDLTRIIGKENILADLKDLLAYSYDATMRQEMPDVIVFPRSTEQVSAIMKLAHREKIPVVPRGAGTNLSGGTIPLKGGIILEISRMNRILEINTADRRAVVESGVVNLDLQNALAPLGYFYPPDPASQKSSTMGGNIGENAGGPMCLRYGVTSKYVYGMEIVLADGEVINIGDYVEDFPGYDLRGLFIGSEGMLGVATKLILHIIPKPEASKTMLAIFDHLEDCGQTVSDIIGAGIVPEAMELLDPTMCWAIEQGVKAGYPTDAAGILLIEVAGLANTLEKQVQEISQFCQKNKVREVRIAQTSAERAAIWAGRRGAFGSVARICPPYIVCDGTVPRDKLPAALHKMGEISEKYKVLIVNVAHAGDGNLHPLILFDVNKPEEQKAAKKAGEDILDTCIAMGGTITGEHGIGLEKIGAMRHIFDPADINAMRKVKDIFDPDDILNPGKMFPPETEAPLSEKERVAR
ncbi:MAG: FAD-linked oxidase C-terminal domain-containing protein [Phycisphaerales bacterium]